MFLPSGLLSMVWLQNLGVGGSSAGVRTGFDSPAGWFSEADSSMSLLLALSVSDLASNTGDSGVWSSPTSLLSIICSIIGRGTVFEL